MFNPYWMVAVNVLLSALLLGSIILYKKRYPKKRLNFLLLIFVVSLLPVVSILRKGSYESGDFTTHVYRSMAFFSSLRDGQLMPSWAGELNANYGYPLFIFLNPLPYYIVAFFHVLGFSFISGMKLLLGLSYILSGVFMYIWCRYLFKNDVAAFVAAVFYLFTPYHLVDLHFRVAVGETLAFTFVPLPFYFIQRLYESRQLKNILWAGCTIALLFLAHQAIALYTIFLLSTYIVFLLLDSRGDRIPFVIKSGVAIALGMLLSSYAWLPHVVYAKYTYAYLLAEGVVSFPPLWELFFTTWWMGFLFQGPNGEIPPVIGYMQLGVLALAIVYLLKKKYVKEKRQLAYWSLISLAIIFLLTPASAFIWESFPILNTTQFASRLLLPLTFCVAVLAGIVAKKNIKRQYFIVGLVLITIGYTVLNWGHRRVIPEMGDETLRQNLPKSSIQGEGFCCMGSPRWVRRDDPWMATPPEAPMTIHKGDGEIKPLVRTSVKHEYVIDAQTPVVVQENTIYFPGWEVASNGRSVNIERPDQEHRGTIVFSLPEGLQLVTVSYTDLPLHKLTKIIAATGFAGILIFLIVDVLSKHRKMPKLYLKKHKK